MVSRFARRRVSCPSSYRLCPWRPARSLASDGVVLLRDNPIVPRDDGAAARAFKTQTSRAPQETSAQYRPAPVVATRAFLRGRVPVWSLGLSLIGGYGPRPIFRQASNGGSFDALQRPHDRCAAGLTQRRRICRRRPPYPLGRASSSYPHRKQSERARESVRSVRNYKLLCAREEPGRRRPRAPVAVTSPTSRDWRGEPCAAVDANARAQA